MRDEGANTENKEQLFDKVLSQLNVLGDLHAVRISKHLEIYLPM